MGPEYGAFNVKLAPAENTAGAKNQATNAL